MKEPHLPIGNSDPVSFTCTCSASSSGLVLLFYRYWAAFPPLPSCHLPQTGDLPALAQWHRQLVEKYHLGGKIRIAKEGFNVTVGGTRDEVISYTQECTSHWSFASLGLSTEPERRVFFKPSSGGCACVFDGVASVKITAEATALGVTNYSPVSWSNISVLSPSEFHAKCHAEPRTLLLDVRNHYESRIGYFVDPKTGEPALRPPIRRFSQFPRYVKRILQVERGEEGGGKENGYGYEYECGNERHIMTYCTGGIRCEKGVRWMQENVELHHGDQVCTLQGGIAAYLLWMDEEIAQGRKGPEESLFRGRNYVFDARGSTGLNASGKLDPVASCIMCSVVSDRLSKCRSRGCHLVLVVCATCEQMGDPRCCQSCYDLDAQGITGGDVGPRPICVCEKEREARLWGGESVKMPKTQGWRKDRKMGSNGMDIQIKTFD